MTTDTLRAALEEAAQIIERMTYCRDGCDCYHCEFVAKSRAALAATPTEQVAVLDTQAHGECDTGQDVPAEVDIASLSYARSIIAMAAELGKGRDVAVMAKIQCAFIHAIQTFAPQSSSVHGECDDGPQRVDETNTSAKHVQISDNNEHIPQSSSVREQEPVAAKPLQNVTWQAIWESGFTATPIETAPPDTQAIRQQAMNDAYERAAKLCDAMFHALDAAKRIRALIGKTEGK